MGFLAALFTFTKWAMLQILTDEVLKYRDQIPRPGLMVFPKPQTALEYASSMSEQPWSRHFGGFFTVLLLTVSSAFS